MGTSAVVVTSPIVARKSLVTAVSHATRAAGSCASIASRIASDTWSHTLSGWPSVTDSEVSRYELDVVNEVMVSGAAWSPAAILAPGEAETGRPAISFPAPQPGSRLAGGPPTRRPPPRPGPAAEPAARRCRPARGRCAGPPIDDPGSAHRRRAGGAAGTRAVRPP